MNKIITIGRQTGSGGHTIGKMVAEKLGVPFYDREIIEEVAQRSGLAENVVENEGENSIKSLLFSLSQHGLAHHGGSTNRDNMLVKDLVNSYQTEFIKELADKGPCVIVGRCADYILSEKENTLHVFVSADFDDRAKRVVEEHQIRRTDAQRHILELDKQRSKYYRYMTDQSWGMSSNYDLCLNSSKLGIERCVEIIIDCCKE